nr:RecName: Full=U1-ctenitoxin-Co1a; Short=U1-CNTX-Co1a; AltName: Full=Neurotoxin Oc F17-11 [Oligoctenus ornatus]
GKCGEINGSCDECYGGSVTCDCY